MVVTGLCDGTARKSTFTNIYFTSPNCTCTDLHKLTKLIFESNLIIHINFHGIVLLVLVVLAMSIISFCMWKSANMDVYLMEACMPTFHSSVHWNKMLWTFPTRATSLEPIYICPPWAVVDDAFPLKSYTLKLYSTLSLTNEQRIFNYRLSRARRNV